MNLSEQQLVDCEKSSYGCEGGFLTSAFKYLQSDKQDLGKDYPYKGTDGACRSAKFPGQVGVSKVNSVPANSAPQLMAAIAEGPVSLALDAGQGVF